MVRLHPCPSFVDILRGWYCYACMKYLSTAIITKEKKWFVARSLELGVVSQGRTVEDAKRNLREAVGLYLEDKPAARKNLTPAHTMVTAIEVGRG